MSFSQTVIWFNNMERTYLWRTNRSTSLNPVQNFRHETHALANLFWPICSFQPLFAIRITSPPFQHFRWTLRTRTLMWKARHHSSLHNRKRRRHPGQHSQASSHEPRDSSHLLRATHIASPAPRNTGTRHQRNMHITGRHWRNTKCCVTNHTNTYIPGTISATKTSRKANKRKQKHTHTHKLQCRLHRETTNTRAREWCICHREHTMQSISTECLQKNRTGAVPTPP